MNKLTRYCQFGLLLLLKLAILTEITLKASWAQIVPDATLGSESSRVTPSVNENGSPIERIEGGAIRGANLFHSFQDFNINEGQGAFFANPAGVENILTRVTGNNPSQILGTLGVLGDANLFLINPNGIFFGPNARLQLNGSFVASTASGLTFNNGFEFSANDPQSPPLLTIDIPIGLRFRDNPGSLINQSRVPQTSNPERLGLSVGDGKNLIFAGGDVRLEGGGLLVLGGQIEIGGLRESGTIVLENNNNNIWRLNYPENVARGNISLTDNATISVGGIQGGNIKIDARNLEILQNTKVVGGVFPNSGLPETRSGNIEINVTDTMRVDNGSVIVNQISEKSLGNSGDIILNVGSLQLMNSATIRTAVYGQGNTGRIIINARGNIELDNGLITNRINEGAVGNTEGILITTGNLVITNTGLISSVVAGQGNTGQINIQARDGVTLSGIDETGENSSSITSTLASESIGNTGDILINAPSLSIIDGASINTATQGTGSAGNIYLQVRGNVFISGEAPTGIHTDSFLAGSGKAGNIFITAVAFNLANGSQLTATSSGDGNGGDINIIAKDAIFNGGNTFVTGIYTITPGGYPQLGLTATGKAGNINIVADSVDLTDGVLFTTLSTTAKGAGDITINAVDSVFITDGSSLLTSGISAGNSGNITIQAGNRVSLDGVGNHFSRLLTALPLNTNLSSLADLPIFNNPSSVISTAVIDLPSASSNNRGQGGNIGITAGSVSVTNGAFLSTTTLGEGNAGNIIIKARDSVFFDGAAPLASTSSLTKESLTSNFNTEIRSPSGASSDVGTVGEIVGKGNGGNIIIETRSLSLTGGAQLSTLTSGQGDAGNIIIQASDGVNISNSDITLPAPSGLLTTTEQGATGKGGEIHITTGNLRVADQSILTARTNSAFNGGNINIQANRLELTNGGQLLTSAFSQGNAGNVTVNASDRITLSGQATNNTFDTNDTAASGIFVRSQQAETGAGDAGRIEVNTPTLILENGASLTSASASVNGGDIFLQVPDLMILRDNSSITASAGTVQAGGNGGNINISSDLLVTFENSDITANAFEGNGGNVNINAQSIFGTEFRPQETSDSDITASSTFGQQGQVILNLSGIDVSRGLAELPEIIVDPDSLIAQNPCTLGKKSRFVDVGRGGLPTSPSDVLTQNETQVSLVEPVLGNTRTQSQKLPTRDNPEPIIPATGLMRNTQGEIFLTAEDATDRVNRRSWRTAVGCQ